MFFKSSIHKRKRHIFTEFGLMSTPKRQFSIIVCFSVKSVSCTRWLSLFWGLYSKMSASSSVTINSSLATSMEYSFKRLPFLSFSILSSLLIAIISFRAETKKCPLPTAGSQIFRSLIMLFASWISSILLYSSSNSLIFHFFDSLNFWTTASLIAFRFGKG